jgi:hypothetical protein
VSDKKLIERRKLEQFKLISEPSASQISAIVLDLAYVCWKYYMLSPLKLVTLTELVVPNEALYDTLP